VFPRPPALALSGALSVALACTLALACADEPEVDPLDPDLIADLSLARGSAVGDVHAGLWSFEFELATCDCPSVDVDGQTQDLCELVQFTPDELQVSHIDGLLAITVDPITLTGAIETDGSFVVASLHDATSLFGPLESLARIDGQFDASSTHADGVVAQRLLGELAGEPLDCGWTGSFTATRP
jgi:hypothetical protein